VQKLHFGYISYAKMMQILPILTAVSDNKVSPAPAATGQCRIKDTSYQTHDTDMLYPKKNKNGDKIPGSDENDNFNYQ